MRKMFWFVVGLAAVVGAFLLGDQQSAAILSGGAGLNVFGMPIGADAQHWTIVASRIALVVSALFLGIALIGYCINYLRFRPNYNTAGEQVVFLMLSAVVCAAAFGAVYRPVTAMGLDPVRWFLSPQGWMLGLMLAPLLFLFVSIVLGLFWSNEKSDKELIAELAVTVASLEAVLSHQLKSVESALAAKISDVGQQTRSTAEVVNKIHHNGLQALWAAGFVKQADGSYKVPEKSLSTLITEVHTSVGHMNNALKPKAA